MVTEKKLKIGKYEVVMIPLVPKEKEYDNVDPNGSPIKYVPGKVERGYYIDETGNKVTNPCKLIGGKAIPKLKKTDEIKPEKIDIVSIDDVNNLITEKEYLVDCDALLQELKEEKSNKAYSFKYTSGNGYKVYRALLYPHPTYKDYAVMKLGTTRISDVITELEEVRTNKEKLKSVSLTLQGIQGSVDDIEIDA
jgi:hypothetical protein